MLCCKCHKNLAVVFISKLNPDGSQQNEGYCLSCAKELNLGPVDNILKKMGIDAEEMDKLNGEMKSVLDEMGDDFDIGDSVNMLRQELEGDADLISPQLDDDDDDEEPMGKSLQRNPFGLLSNFSNSDDRGEQNRRPNGPRRAPRERGRKKNSMLDTYGVNLTERAKKGEIDAVIGRDSEIERTIQILNRRTKNNPCLIGEPGVGKTAIAEGLAIKIVNGDIPSKLRNMEIYLLDMTSVIAGTQFRGQFESRLKNIINEVKKAGNIILVIDEIHTIASAGDAEGGMNAGNILKPALAKGEIQIIGATTIDEYRKHIEKDSALERRFQTVMVEEPSVEETIEILKGIKSYYENYHHVIITDEIIRTATILSERYIQDRFLPDKAIDVIDEAASKVNLRNHELVKLEDLNKELEETVGKKDAAAEADNYQEAADLKVKELQLRSQIEDLQKSVVKYIEPEDVAAVVESWTKIPVKHISEYESEQLTDLENRLHKGVIGQDAAVKSAANAIRRKRAGINLKRRPVSFIFVGPTGVGKTELAKQIAREVFDGEESLIRLDMSEYMEKHSVSKIIGSPPGYVGYDEAGQLTEKIRRKPYSVILLDEIEKAHEDVFNILLQILDDGRITDSHGKVVNFENTIIIMTSNAGSDNKSNVVGFNESEEATRIKIDRALKQLFRPEFLNRVDDVIIFNELGKDDLVGIVDLMLNDLRAGLKEKDIGLDVSESAKELVVEKSYDKLYGARPMRRYIEKNIEDRLAKLLIDRTLVHGTTAYVDTSNGEISVAVMPTVPVSSDANTK